MSKVYFYYSCMESGKSMACLINIYQYRKNNINTLILSPDCAEDFISSRVSDEKIPSVKIGNKLPSTFVTKDTGVIIIDEVQFLTSKQIEDLFRISMHDNIPVICYGLLTDFKTHMFEGSKRLIELGAKLQLLKSYGSLGELPVVNARYIGDSIQTEGEVTLIEKASYKPMTLREYWSEIGGNKQWVSLYYQ